MEGISPGFIGHLQTDAKPEWVTVPFGDGRIRREQFADREGSVDLMRAARQLCIVFWTSLLVIAGAGAANAQTHVLNLDSEGYAIERYDPVAYFTEGRPIRGKERLSAEHEGAKYAFSSEDNRALFLGNPDKYAPQFGGYCAYGATYGSKSDIDPEVWEIVDGRLLEVEATGS